MKDLDFILSIYLFINLFYFILLLLLLLFFFLEGGGGGVQISTSGKIPKRGRGVKLTTGKMW